MRQQIKKNVEEKRGEIESTIVKPIFRTSTNYKRFPKTIPELDKTRLTESAGYQTVEQKVNMLLDAGERLETFRKENYDFPDGKIEDSIDDPTRQRGFDHLDAHQLNMETQESLDKQKTVLENQRKEATRKEKKEIDEKLKRLEEYEKNNPVLQSSAEQENLDKTSEK